MSQLLPPTRLFWLPSIVNIILFTPYTSSKFIEHSKQTNLEGVYWFLLIIQHKYYLVSLFSHAELPRGRWSNQVSSKSGTSSLSCSQRYTAFPVDGEGCFPQSDFLLLKLKFLTLASFPKTQLQNCGKHHNQISVVISLLQNYTRIKTNIVLTYSRYNHILIMLK